jgi:hypothetical protein
MPPALSVLGIQGLIDSDDGNYTCQVANGIGLPATAVIELRVKRPPVILADSVLKAGEDANIGRSATFVCKARAYPDVTFRWKLPVGFTSY